MEFRSTEPGTPLRRRAVNEAQAVDEHQGALRAEVAEVDLGRAGADAAAVRRIAEVAGVVELAVEAAAGARQALKHVVDRVEAGLGDVRLVDEYARGIEVERVAADARPGDRRCRPGRAEPASTDAAGWVRRRREAGTLRLCSTRGRRKRRKSDASAKDARKSAS